MVHSDVAPLMDLAMQKLCGHRTFHPHDVDHMLAIVDQRFDLDFRTHHPETFEHVERGVTNHLRVCYSSADRTWTFTGYPSEPLLSCISAYVLHREPSALREWLDTLQKKIYRRMISTDAPGALAGRLLWLLAKDLFVRTCLPNYRGLFVKAPGMNQWDTELIDCQMVPIIPFLGFVFGKKHWEGEVEKAFANAYINFSHWMTMESAIAEKGQHRLRYSLLDYHLPSAPLIGGIAVKSGHGITGLGHVPSSFVVISHLLTR